MIDDHSRVAYVEICADEKAQTAIGVLERAVERVLSDNGSYAGSTSVWSPSALDLGIGGRYLHTLGGARWVLGRRVHHRTHEIDEVCPFEILRAREQLRLG